METFDYAGTLLSCAEGDRSALRRLYDEEAGRLIAVALRIVRRRELAEDVVHDAFIAIWQRAATFDPAIGSARAWIYTVVRNRALNALRDGKREDLSDAADAGQEPAPDSIISDAVERLASESRLRGCLERLEPEKRDCVLLSYVTGFSHAEISDRLGVPLGTVKSWVKRGLAALQECMA
jgi:RNA polymerase sigma-70 factor (ECF subfamily)